jgi:hypothetical protein
MTRQTPDPPACEHQPPVLARQDLTEAQITTRRLLLEPLSAADTDAPEARDEASAEIDYWPVEDIRY